MPIRRTFLIERQTLPSEGNRTLQYYVKPGARSRPWVWFKLHEVPDFEGESAYFECVRENKRWKVVKQVTS